VPEDERPADTIAVFVDLRLGDCRFVPQMIVYRTRSSLPAHERCHLALRKPRHLPLKVTTTTGPAAPRSAGRSRRRPGLHDTSPSLAVPRQPGADLLGDADLQYPLLPRTRRRPAAGPAAGPAQRGRGRLLAGVAAEHRHRPVLGIGRVGLHHEPARPALERADGSAPVAGFGSAPTDTSAVSALAAAGSTVPVEPSVPGGPAPRLRPGDTLVVWRLDRLGRSLRHLIDVVTGLDERGVGFRSLRERIDTTTAGGRLVFHLFGVLAQFEREIIRDASTSRLTIGPPAHVPPGVNAARGGRVWT